jgi:hypothetical protein
MAVPYTFANATTSIPLSQLDANFSYFGNAITVSANTTSITIDSSKNLGVGTASPNSYGANITTIDVEGSSGGGIKFGNTTASFGAYYNGGNGYLQTFNSSPIVFSINNSEAARIDTSSNLLVGTTSALGTALNVFNSNGYQLLLRCTSASAGKCWTLGANGSNAFQIYNQDGTGQYMTNGGTTWIANSDERLKTDLQPIEDATNKISSLRSVIGRFKTDPEGTQRSFLIAQDVQSVFPEAVNVQDDENKTLGLAYTDIIPLLVASIKELKTTVDAQAAQIANLTSKVGA